MGKAAVQMPGEEQPLTLWIGVRQAAPREAHTSQLWFRRRRERPEMSLGAADGSVCATELASQLVRLAETFH
jgi:hypothetical protein